MGLSRQVHHVSDAVALHDVEDSRFVPQIHLLKDILRVLLHPR